MTRSEGKTNSIRWVVQVVHISDPPINSPAALALLAKKYYTLDRSIYSEFRMTRLRNKWMKLQMKSPDALGGLTCGICGRKGLKYKDHTQENLATLDHIVEIFKGGDWRDPSNFQVACKKCNDSKNNKWQKNEANIRNNARQHKKHLTPLRNWCNLRA